LKRLVVYILLLFVCLVCWQVLGSRYSSIKILVSTPEMVTQYSLANSQKLLQATIITLIEASSGLILAVMFSFLAMILCFIFPKFMDFILPLMIASQVIPLVVLAPFFIIILGIGIGSKIAMAALMSFFPIFINFAQGYKSISTNVHELLHIYNTSKLFKIRNIYFPLAMPNIMAGLKISSTLAVIGAIVAEFTGAEQGLGKNLYLAAKRLEPDLLMSSLFLSILLGCIFFLTIYIIEILFGKWYLNK